MNTIINNCPKCSAEFNAWSKWGVKKYCSRSCANGHTKTPEQKLKISQIIKSSPRAIAANATRIGTFTVQRIDRVCIKCSKIFTTKITVDKKYCGNDCWRKDAGGYREGSGRSHSGYYKGIYCGSTYELCWVIHSLDHGIGFTRFPSILEKNGLKYYPDFLLTDGKTIIETKGFEKNETVDKKTALAESLGYKVQILRKDDLQYAFKYAAEKYKTTDYRTLYDGYKPKYNYKCGCCLIEFSKDKKSKTDVVYCSRTCAGKGHKGRKVKSL